MLHLHVVTSDALGPVTTRELRAMLDAAFDGEFSHHDWAHANGGVHVWLSGADGIVSHGSLVTRTLVCDGHTLVVGYVEAVATAAAYRRQGHGATVMRHIGELIQTRHPLGVLSTGPHAFYEKLGWQRWRGSTFVQGASGLVRTASDDDGVMVLTTPSSPALDLGGTLVANHRPGDIW
jgi:aminoglycoside 2'-N-acetyltransferase I